MRSEPTHAQGWRRARTNGLPILQWARVYDRATLIDDAVAALIVTLMLIPQSLAYAMLAGLPAQVGLYASIAPLLAYAVFGSSRVLAVGPVAVISLMTATAVGAVAPPGTAEHAAAAITLLGDDERWRAMHRAALARGPGPNWDAIAARFEALL